LLSESQTLAEIDHNQAVREITQTLRGPVAAVFRKLVPAFQDIKAEDFYDQVIANAELLHGCLLIFRKRRDAFGALLVDADGRTVNDDFVRLRCGRTVHDITAMIVRTHAKQHFRKTLGGDPNDPTSKSGKLYSAMNEYLIHEWQVPLTTAYAKLSAETISTLGPALMDLKTVAAVEAVATAVAGAVATAPSAGTVPVTQVTSQAAANDSQPKKAAEPVMVAIDQREADFWWETLNDPNVRSALGRMTETEMRELTAAFCAVGDTTRSELLKPLGFSLYQAAVVFTTLYRAQGRAAFGQMFGKPGNPAAVKDFTKRLQVKNIGSRTDMKTLVTATEGALQGAARPGRTGTR
jgi:hypothetical protein